MSLAVEAETSAVFVNAQLALPIRYALGSRGHPQPQTPIKTDNYTTARCFYSNMQKKRSKYWDMRFHWLRDKGTHNELNVLWDTRINNKADYYRKYHPTKYQLDIWWRNLFIRDNEANPVIREDVLIRHRDMLLTDNGHKSKHA